MTPLKESNGWSKVSEAHIDLVNRTKAAWQYNIMYI